MVYMGSIKRDNTFLIAYNLPNVRRHESFLMRGLTGHMAMAQMVV